ncbi:hypothetical protein Bca101_071290 [Brassica carinata]
MFDNRQVIANTNLETGKHNIFGSSKQDYNQANSSGMTYQQLKLLSPKDCIDYGFWEEKDLAPEKRLISELISPFQAEQQMEANFSGSSSTSRQNQKIDVGGRLIKGILRRCETVQPDFIFCTA